MKAIKRIISSLLVVFLLISTCLLLTPPKPVFAASGVYDKLISLKSKFPDGKFWNHAKPASEVGHDCRDEYFADFVTSSPCASHNSQVGAGQNDCNYFDGGIQCCGFARKVFFDLFGERETSNSLVRRTDTGNLQVGDYVAINNEGHYCVVLSVSGSTFTCVECNLDQLGASYNCKIRWNYSYNKSQITYFVHSSKWDSVNNSYVVNPSISWSVYSNQEIKEGKVVLAKTATLSGATMDNVSTVGIDIYNSNNSLIKSKEEVPNRSGHTYVDIWYDLSSELGLSITPGTAYKYSFWVKINGKKYESTRETVTCPPVYTVKFDSQGGSSVSQMTVGKNQSISTLPTSTRSGYVLDGWYTAVSGGTKLTTSTKITGNITYYAHWNKNSFTITLGTVSNGTASLSKTSASQGDEITVNTSPAAGYTLDKITVNGTAITGNKFTMPAQNTTVGVTFKKISYTVSLSSVSN
ncbi:MAG: InlB B-repeat-containing protein, partial [Clostridiales bacterium]|nr:InlB B-repeat-containing protein [Clostridiales bacterium]